MRCCSVYLFLFVLCLSCIQVGAQSFCRITRYDEASGLPLRHVTQIVEDKYGLIWMGTGNGLCRFDGYQFTTFKSGVGDGCNMSTDRIRNLAPSDDGHLYCKVDEQYFGFNLSNYRFYNLNARDPRRASDKMGENRRNGAFVSAKKIDCYHTQWLFMRTGKLYCRYPGDAAYHEYPTDVTIQSIKLVHADKQGNLWAISNDGIYKLSFFPQRAIQLPQQVPAQVRCMFLDYKNRYWVTTREDATVRIYDAHNRLLGYLGRDGSLHQQYTSFGSPVYCMYQSASGTIWLGSKPDGLYRLKETTSGHFFIEHFTQLPSTDIYHIIADSSHRLWIATSGGGIVCVDSAEAKKPHFIVPKYYPKNQCDRVRYLHITRHHILMAATTGGLVITRLQPQVSAMKFTCHHKEPLRANSLSNNATMDICEDAGHHLYISTESGGINEIVSSNLLAGKLVFRHLGADGDRLPSDVIFSLTAIRPHELLAVSSHQFFRIRNHHKIQTLDDCFFHHNYLYNDAHPLRLPDGRWMFGLMDGAMLVHPDVWKPTCFSPRIALTSFTIQNSHENLAVEDEDTLTLQPDERSITIRFSALDYREPKNISYRFRLLKEGETTKTWNELGQDHTVTLLDLQPGTYRVEIISTNAEGVWQQNMRQLTVIVKPYFIETAWAKLLIFLLVAGILSGVIATYLYIRRMKRKQHETLEAYLSLLDQHTSVGSISSSTSQSSIVPAESEIHTETDVLMQRVMTYVEQHLQDTDINVGDMAEAAATSRSGLQRRMKQLMGITPIEFLHQARMKRACQLLQETDKTVSEVAWMCGFNDPKYFSRCFKTATGMSPSDYKNRS